MDAASTMSREDHREDTEVARCGGAACRLPDVRPMASWWRYVITAGVAAGALAGMAASGREAKATDADATAAHEKCATRVSVALLGRGATPDLLASADPQSAVDGYLADPRFVERFARFLNASFNMTPGTKPEEDAAYWLGKYVLQNDLPYADLFVGKYDVDVDATGNVVVKDDPQGLGYFRSLPWLRLYAGNEPTGLKIRTAYRMMNNTVGLHLIASTASPDQDRTANGRSQGVCAGCHYQQWSALDLAAMVLTRRNGAGDTMTFTPPTGGPQHIADRTVSNDEELVHALVESEAFVFNTCRLSFQFLYGRPENACESTVFDACVDAFKSKGTIQAALSVIAKDPSFCQ